MMRRSFIQSILCSISFLHKPEDKEHFSISGGTWWIEHSPNLNADILNGIMSEDDIDITVRFTKKITQ